jgi:hypothetical protein
VTALLVGTVLAVASLLYVLFPLFRAELATTPLPTRKFATRTSTALDALRELEFDRQTGKISDADYEALKGRYTEQALAVMRAGNAPLCKKCGPRPESDADYCSSCGAAVIG